jgi:hypothetical protein
VTFEGAQPDGEEIAAIAAALLAREAPPQAPPELPSRWAMAGRAYAGEQDEVGVF